MASNHVETPRIAEEIESNFETCEDASLHQNIDPNDERNVSPIASAIF